jgi:hypothetical protein
MFYKNRKLKTGIAVLFTAFPAVFCQGAPVQVGTPLERVIQQRAANKESTTDAPDTAHGKKACAWFVNSSFEQAYGTPIATGRAYSDVLGTLKAMLYHPKTFFESGSLSFWHGLYRNHKDRFHSRPR